MSENKIHTIVVTPFKNEVEMTIKYINLLKNEKFDQAIMYDNGSREEVIRDIRNFIPDDPRFTIVDASGWKLHQMWNHAWSEAVSKFDIFNIAFFNNDIEWSEPLVEKMSELLRSQDQVGCVYPDHGYFNTDAKFVLTPTTGTKKDGGMCGFCFMLRGELAPDEMPYVDENLIWWFGDDHVEMNVRKANYYVCRINGLHITHIEEATAANGENTWVEEAKRKDAEYWYSTYH